MATQFRHATVVAQGRVYIPTTFLLENGYKTMGSVNFIPGVDGLSFTLEIGKKGQKMSNGNFHLNVTVAETVIRSIIENKPEGYPYKYKGVYLLKHESPNIISGTLVTDWVTGINS